MAGLSRQPYELVIAIDFGTTGSGYAFQSRSDFVSDRLCIYENLEWGNETLECKTPTCLLVSPDKRTVYFGTEAEVMYVKLRQRDNPQQWYFFRNFKMQLYGKEGNMQIRSDIVLTSENGNTLPAVFVFAESIKWMKNRVLDIITKSAYSKVRYSQETTRWVLTVPAIWTEGAKQVMRKAAQEAGIDSQNICIALEPEAAAVYCTVVEANPTSQPTSRFDRTVYAGPGTRNIIVDMGGGTVDITTIEIGTDGKMRQIRASDGGPAGGQNVDNKFFQLMSDFLGEELWNSFMRIRPADFYDFRKSLEKAKKQLKPKLRHSGQRDDFLLSVPVDILRDFANRNGEEDITLALKRNQTTKGQVDFEYGRLVFPGEILRKLMNESLEEILEYIQRIVNDAKRDGCRIHSVILVGGFASSNFMNTEMTSYIKDNLRLEVRRPEKCELAVLRGAVLYGQDESILKSRIVRMTYGVGVTMPYSPQYPVEKKFEMEGGSYVTGVFVPHVKRGQEVNIDEWVSANEYYPLEKDPKDVMIYIFSSPRTDTKSIDEEDCTCIGHFKINFDEGSALKRASTEISFNFGRTELIVRARDSVTGSEVFTSICLEV